MQPGITIYHYPRCRKSNAALDFLRQHKLAFSIREYHRKPFTKKELEDLLMRLNKKPAEIIRTRDKDYIARFRNKDFQDHEWIRILLEYPNLIRRPVVVKGLKAVIGEDIENVRELLSLQPNGKDDI